MLTQTPTTLAAEVKGLHKVFGKHHVLNDVSLEVPKGQVLAIIGPSGSGKSTFIRCLNLLERPSAGTLGINGQEVWSDTRTPSRSKMQELRRNVGMVFQTFNLFPTQSAIENVSLAQVHALGRSKKEANDRSLELLTKVGLAQWADHRPSQLSGGQQQRVAIARAMALDPEILIFDEPTSAIDPELRVDVLRVMKDVAATGVTMLVVTHEMQFARSVADRVVFFADGNILEDGSPKEIFDAPRHARTQRFLSAVLEEDL